MKKLLLLGALTFIVTNALFSQNLPSYVPTNGLVGYWPFEGNANDASGKGNHGTVNGATLTTDRNGITNSAYSFDGLSNYVQLGPNDFNAINILDNNNFTVSFWVNDLKGASSYFMNFGWGVHIYNSIDSLKPAFGHVGIWPDNKWYNVKSKSSIKLNNWYHIVAVKNNNLQFIYINGVLNGTSTSTPAGLGEQVYIGGNPIDNNGWTKGFLDDYGFWSRALTEQEITTLYNNGSQSTLSSTKIYVAAPASVKQNDTLELSISTEALNSSDNVIAFQTDFTYDSTRYTYISNQVATSINPAATVDVNTSKKGLIKLGYMTQTALNGAGSLVKLKFKANNTLGQGIFGLSNFLYNTTAITSLKNDTVTTLDAIPPSAKLSYSQNPVRKGDSLLITVNFSEKMAIAPVPQVNLSGQNTLANANLTKVNDTTYTYWWVVEKGNGLVNVTLASGKDLAGNNIVATPTQNASFTVLPTIFGDIDTNKFIQAYDGALALQYSVGLNPLPSMDPLPWSNWRIAVANVDTVGNITANDASLILQKSIDKIASFPADAKKRGDAPLANITVTQEANQLVFRATGTLFAFNVFMKDNFNAFGQPEVKDKNAMIATNITSTTYNVGLASTTPFVENEPFLLLPILTNDNLQGTMDIVANTQEKALAYGKAASIATIQNDAMVVYPNPTKDVVTINNAQGKTLRIIDFQGRLVNTQIVTSNAHEVSLKAIATKGEYIFQLIGENNETITTQKVMMQ